LSSSSDEFDVESDVTDELDELDELEELDVFDEPEDVEEVSPHAPAAASRDAAAMSDNTCLHNFMICLLSLNECFLIL
jgi:hypothetical protein